MLWAGRQQKDEEYLRRLGKWAVLNRVGMIALSGFNLLLRQSLHEAAVVVTYNQRVEYDLFSSLY